MGTLEHAQQIAGQASPKTTKLYDRTADTATVDELQARARGYGSRCTRSDAPESDWLIVFRRFGELTSTHLRHRTLGAPR